MIQVVQVLSWKDSCTLMIIFESHNIIQEK